MVAAKGKKQKKKKNIFLRLACEAFAVYVVVQVVSVRVQLWNKTRELESLEEANRQQQLINESLKDKNENPEKYLNDEARDQGFSLPGEQIFQVVPGN